MEVRRLQRLRIRRAGRGVRPADLVAMSAVGADAQEIPGDELSNAMWYRVQANSALRRGLEKLQPAQRAPLGGFVSRHWRHLWIAACNSEAALGRMLDELSDYLAYCGRRPGRRSDPVRLLEESRAWHDQAQWEKTAGLPVDWELPTGGLETWRRPGVEVRPLRTVRELVEESQRMRHCVAMHARDAAVGRRVILHAEIEGRPLTVMARRGEHGVSVLEAAGKCNRVVTERERGMLRRWVTWVNGRDEEGLSS